MKVTIYNEVGYKEALIGLSLSFYDHKEPIAVWWTEDKYIKADKRAKLLAFKDGGHNKFLESIHVWVYIQATRGFWSEFDTYREGMTKQSASTMHTLDKREVTLADFEVGTSSKIVDEFNNCLHSYKNPDSMWYKDITRLKDNLPEGWFQERMVCTNYKTLQNIVSQRDKHRYKHWATFINELLLQVEHPELLTNQGN
jgi:hypothetical protein